MPKITIITPILNEEENLPSFRARLVETLRQIDAECEIILADDHSTDQSPQIAKAWMREDPRVCYLRLSRTFGPHAAAAAALTRSTGDCAVLLSSDLQDPPELIPSLIEKWRSGYDVVWGARAVPPRESWAKNIANDLFYSMLRRIAMPDLPQRGAEYMLLDRKVIDAYLAIREKHTNFVGMVLWMGYRQTSISYVRQDRQAGRSKWNLSKKLKLLVDSIVSFSYAPIRLASLLGVCLSLLGFLYALGLVFNKLWGSPEAGWSSTMAAVLVIGGCQLLMLGVIGEYIWRTFDEARGRPRYLIEEFVCRASERQELDRVGPRDENSNERRG